MSNLRRAGSIPAVAIAVGLLLPIQASAQAPPVRHDTVESTALNFEKSLKIPPRLWPVMIDCLLAYDDTRELGGIRAPTQLLWGHNDALFSRAQQDAFLAALPAARLKVYQETGHCPNRERPPRRATHSVRYARSTLSWREKKS